MEEVSKHAAKEPRLAIVSDDPQYGRLLAYGMQVAGFTAAVIENDGDPSAVIARTNPDLLIVDMSIAVADGLKLLHRLQDERLPILVLSSSDDRALSVESLVAGAQDVLVKPATFPVILERVRRLLGEMVDVSDR